MKCYLRKVEQVFQVVLAVLIVGMLTHNIGADMSAGFGWIPNAAQDFRQDIWSIIQRNDAKNAREDAYNQQKEFAQHGIRWRVEDAKAAGLHPLYALGGGGASFSPSFALGAMPGSASGGGSIIDGQDTSVAARGGQTAEELQLHDARLQLLRSQIDETDARTWAIWSQEARATQNANVSSPIPGSISATQPVPPMRVKPKADEVISQRFGEPEVTAGVHAGLREYWLTPSLKMRLPYSEEGPSEALENIPWYMWPAMIQHNRSYYGSDWGTRFMKEFVFGQAPVYRQMPSPRSRSRDYETIRRHAPRFSQW